MSWDIDLIEAGEVVAEFNYTHNTNAAIRSVGVDWSMSNLGGMTAQDLGVQVGLFLDAVRQRPEEFTQFDAENGWGWVCPRVGSPHNSLVQVLTALYEACEEHPRATVMASF